MNIVIIVSADCVCGAQPPVGSTLYASIHVELRCQKIQFKTVFRPIYGRAKTALNQFVAMILLASSLWYKVICIFSRRRHLISYLYKFQLNIAIHVSKSESQENLNKRKK